MIKKLKRMITALSISLSLLVPVAVPAVANAAIRDQFCQGAGAAAGGAGACADTNTTDAGLKSLVGKIVDWFSWLVGVISVVMIVFGGFRYITSGGDSNKVTSAKNTIIYAIIGLVIVAAAQFIVNFVVARGTEVSSGA